MVDNRFVGVTCSPVRSFNRMEALLKTKYGDSGFSSYFFVHKKAKKNNSANVQSSLPHGWSISHIHLATDPFFNTAIDDRKPGRKGEKGVTGAKEDSGTPGKSVPGSPGAKRDRGAAGKPGQPGKSGIKYVRWGKTTCPGGAQIVYKG
ncbi:hypothetical protein AWC38_SpisGene19969 [Stylophora pistillata]|uniref:Uncharacterized protein n=1 Tax=Stylophora pistillata TaxID=50429 RepID=A0A2B4RHD4_STYPI|nr:hypothetical protein AWC38_SpisGene19969 [Stylophora pistillata]